MCLKKILTILLINSLVILMPTISWSEEIGYQFDWNLEPLKYVDDQFYIERIIDLRPESEKKVEADPNRPVFLTTDIEVHLKSYMDKAYSKADYKTPIVLKIKRLNFSYWEADNKKYAKTEIIIEFYLHIEGKIGKILTINDFSIADSDAGLAGLYEKCLCSVMEQSLKAYSGLNQETVTPVWEEYQEEETKQESSNENDLSANDDPSFSSDTKTVAKEITDEQNEYDLITFMFSERGATFGGVHVDEKPQFGFDLSVCNLYPSDEAEAKTGHWGIDAFILLPVVKPLYLGLGVGFYYELFTMDECNNYGGLAELQLITEKYLIGYGYHRLKGYYIRLGYRI